MVKMLHLIVPALLLLVGLTSAPASAEPLWVACYIDEAMGEGYCVGAEAEDGVGPCYAWQTHGHWQLNECVTTSDIKVRPIQ